jgi:S-adenosylmethionine hydrolase
MDRPIVFMSDYGFRDEFAGVCRAVIAGIAPSAPIVDLTHSVPQKDILAGALTLARSAPFFPSDSVVLGVVDPGVGTDRRPMVVGTGRGPLLVGPDNGLFSLAWEVLGGAQRAVEITASNLVLPATSATFHGRDVFAPIAAHLAAGTELSSVGPDIPPDDLVRIAVPAPRLLDDRIEARVMAIDRFGNVELNVRPDHLVAAQVRDEMRVGPFTLRRARTFGDVGRGELAFLVDSSGWVALVAGGASAAVALAVKRGDQVVLAPSETNPP